MRKNFIKTMAVVVSVASIITVAPTVAKAAEVGVGNSVVTRNIPSYPFHEFTYKDDFSGNVKVTRDNLPNTAKALYDANKENGDKVLALINHANYFAETRYSVDGQVRGNREGYKAAYVGAGLELYFNYESSKWIDALYPKNNSYEEAVDNYNAYWASEYYSHNMSDTYPVESSIEIFANWMVDNGCIKTSTDRSIAGLNRTLSAKQKDIKAKNPQFAAAAYADYAKAYKLGRGVSFNDQYDALNRAIYGALLYKDAKQYNASEQDVIDWIEGQFYYEISKPSKIAYSYYENAMNGYKEAERRNITTEKEAETLGIFLGNNHGLIYVDENNNFKVGQYQMY